VHLWRDHGRWAWIMRPCRIVLCGARHRGCLAGWISATRDRAVLVLFFVAIFAGVPVGFVLLIATAAYLWATGANSSSCAADHGQRHGNYILLAVPFFILAG